MRPSHDLVSRLSPVALATLASLAACSTDPAPPSTTDSGPPPMDVSVTDTPAVDVRPPPVDKLPPLDSIFVPIDTPQPTDGPIEEFIEPADVPAPTDGPRAQCEITPAVATHVNAMATGGWAALNRTRGLLMHGCSGATRPQDCLASAPLVNTTSFGSMWPTLAGTRLKLLFTSTYSSPFWSRSSADGRFVAHGNRIVDLTGPRVITTGAQYDPGFFPDNSSFVFHTSGGPRVCMQSLLSTGMPTNVTLNEPECVRIGSIALYEHPGVSLNGQDYFVVYGRYTSDNGGHNPTLSDPAAGFGAGEVTRLTLMANTGSSFREVTTASVATPMEADPILSPSSQLLMMRLAGTGGAQSAFVLRRLQITRTGNALTVTAPVIARYCQSGAKGSISYDERWFAYHHYITAADATDLGFTGPNDPAFAAYRTRGAANVYLVDLRTGERRRLTNMQPGQYALYPHFRSDGWIYFIVRTAGMTPEHIVASDAALALP